MVPGKFAEQLPAYVINGLVNALQILPEDRTRSVEELRAELSASPSAVAVASRDFNPPATPVAPPKPKYQTTAQRLDFEEEEDLTAEKREAAQRRHYFSTAVVSAALVIIIVVGAFIALEMTHVTNFFSDETTTTVVNNELIDVPNFVGQDYSDVINNEYNKKNFKFRKVDSYSETADADVIISQSEAVDSQVKKGSVIILTVSVGKESIQFPKDNGTIIGQTYENAEKYLRNLGFNVQKISKQNIGNQVAGTVASHNCELGKSYNKGHTVVLSVWEEEETMTLASEPSTEDPTYLLPGDSSDALSDILDNNPFIW